MASKELIEKVARDLANLNDGTEETWEIYHADAQKACSTILAALQEPTEQMRAAGWDYLGDETWNPTTLELNLTFKGMLNASPLGEQSE